MSSTMKCHGCQKELSPSNFAVITGHHYCLKCLSTDASLWDETPKPNAKRAQTASRITVRSKPKLEVKQCGVCFDEKPIDSFQHQFSSRCRHTSRVICNDCLYQHVKQGFSKMCNDDARCPELGCGIPFKYRTVQKILTNNHDRALVEKYDRFVLHRQLENMPEFIWCAHGCGMGQLNEGGDENNIVTCTKCRRKTCFTHKTKWHAGMTCEEYDARQNPQHEATRRWIVQNSKKCPQCLCRIEKADGCDHMTCAQCRYEFCWSCLADYNLIRKDGNHRHDAQCKHYAAYHRS